VTLTILVCFLALVMWRSLEMWMKASGLGDCARQALKELETIRSMDVVVPVKYRAPVRLRLVAKPGQLAADLPRMGLRLPNRPKQVQNVVENITPR
jgi:hypothetical protein